MNRQDINDRVKKHPEESLNDIKRHFTSKMHNILRSIEKEKQPGYIWDLIMLLQEACFKTTKDVAHYMIDVGIRDGQKGRDQNQKEEAP